MSGALDPLFAALEHADFAAVAFEEMNNGIFALRPNREMLGCMLRQADAGVYWAEPFEQDFQRRGG